jgi:hypothetical protein
MQKDGIVAAIIIGVLTMSTTPWWWHRLFDDATPRDAKAEVLPNPPATPRTSPIALPTNESPSQPISGEYLYQADLGDADHCNSQGQRLAVAGMVVQQDRANFYKNKRDSGDQSDGQFADFEARLQLAKTAWMDAATAHKILTTKPTVRVAQTATGYHVTISREGEPFISCQ